MQWFRFYSEALDDPKVQRLPGDLFKAWVNLLCLANEADERGTLPDVADIAFRLRMDDQKTADALRGLCRAGLLDGDEDDGYSIHAWDKRQPDSDSSTERVRRHRAKKQQVTPPATGGNSSETLPKRSSNALDKNRIDQTREEERRVDTGDAPPAAASVRPAPKPSTLNRQQQERFDRFYAAYPNKQHRPEAERAWRKLDPDDTLTATLLADLAERKQGRKWGDRIIEHPSTYLNNRVWEDDIEPVRIQPSRASPNGAGKVTNGFMASWERDNGKDQHEPHDVSPVIDAPFTVRTAHGR